MSGGLACAGGGSPEHQHRRATLLRLRSLRSDDLAMCGTRGLKELLGWVPPPLLRGMFFLHLWIASGVVNGSDRDSDASWEGDP